MKALKRILKTLMADIKVTCGKCGHEFWMSEFKAVACPKCGHICRGPKS